MVERSTPGEPKSAYVFAAGYVDGRAHMTELLGGKGANLAEMASLGLPVPPGFTITTQVCDAYYRLGRKLPDGLKPQVEKALQLVGEEVGGKFGDVERPLLVSVRSGARASMPGMMDTILNLGLNDETVEALARRSRDRRFAYDSYRRFIQMYADVVLGVDHGVFEDILDNFKNLNGLTSDTELSADDWAEIVEEYNGRSSASSASRSRRIRPSNSTAQSPPCSAPGRTRAPRPTGGCTTFPTPGARPSRCRRWCSAIWGRRSATGVAFTRNPSTGANGALWRVPAQRPGRGCRRRHPHAASADGQGARGDTDETTSSLETLMPDVFGSLTAIFQRLESHYRDMQDVEFTVENGKLWILQTRSGKRTAEAALRIAVDLAKRRR